jgi:hypothetical protein
MRSRFRFGLVVCAMFLAMRPCLASVLILGGPSDSTWNNDVKAKILASDVIGDPIDIFNVRSGTPTAAQLKAYRAVLVFSDDPGFADPTTLGNLLADYVDNGGGVVIAPFATAQPGLVITGRFATGNYSPVLFASQNQNTHLTIGTREVPTHPLLQGVGTFDGGSSSFYTTGTRRPGAIAVADWSNGQPLVTEWPAPTTRHPVVALNFFPPSSDARNDFWLATTNGGRLMANALNFAATPEPSGIFLPTVLFTFALAQRPTSARS